MKGDSLLKKIIYSSWFLAGIPAIIVLLMYHPVNSRLTLTVEPFNLIDGKVKYSDLNSDSISELINSAKGVPYFYIVVRDNNLRFYDQWNLKDLMDKRLAECFFGNFDDDKFQEIYAFTHKEDSLFLNVNEILAPSGTKLERIFITKIGYIKGEVTSVLMPAGFFDRDGDGMKELYFIITTAYDYEPRRLYSFNLVNKSLQTSQFTGTISIDPEMADSDGDLRPEIFGTMSAPGNYHTKVPYSDSSTWFMVFKDDLSFEFPPVEFQGFANTLEISAFKHDTSKVYILSHCTWGTDPSTLEPRISVYSTMGKLIRSRLYSEFGVLKHVRLYVTRYKGVDKIFILEDKFIELNDNLEVIQKISLPFKSKVSPYQADLNSDGENEFLLYSESEEKLVAYDGGLNKIGESEFKAPDTMWQLSQFLSADRKSKLFFLSADKGYFIDLKKNYFYYVRFLIYPGIYISFLFFILLIRRINTYQVVQREGLKRRLLTLQLQSVKSQLDPHFTFNALNSIASLIYLEDRKNAYDYMNKFTCILRGILNDADQVYRKLSEELEIVTAYMELEKLRFGDKFIYEIELDESLSGQELVPKMVLQTFSENAIKHGLLPGVDGGKIKIIAVRESDYLRLTVEDNGIGRSLAAGHSTSTGRGLKITDEFYDVLNQINKKPIKHTITDLYTDSNIPSGTRVEIWVPLDEPLKHT